MIVSNNTFILVAIGEYSGTACIVTIYFCIIILLSIQQLSRFIFGQPQYRNDDHNQKTVRFRGLGILCFYCSELLNI